MANPLTIYYGQDIVGQLDYIIHSNTYSLIYHQSWIEQGFAISPHIPLVGAIESSSIHKFLENLLPEGTGLDELSRYAQVSKNNTIALTRLIGHETTGALTFTDQLLPSIETKFIRIDRNEIAERIANRPYQSLTIWNDKPRLSAAGLQDKLLVCVHNNEYGFGEGDLASTHILKFERESSRHLVINEFICMTMAKMVGFPVATVALERIGDYPALSVERFDRRTISSQLVERLHIIDGCQALDLLPSYKYEHNFGNTRDVNHIRDGASLEDLFNFCQSCRTPAKAEMILIEWVVCNTIFSNTDAHGKNISFFIDKSGIHPALFYDIVDITMHSEFDQSMAMAIGDCFNYSELTSWHVKGLCDECGLSQKLVVQQIHRFVKNVLTEIVAVDYSHFLINQDERLFARELLDNIAERAKYLLGHIKCE